MSMTPNNPEYEEELERLCREEEEELDYFYHHVFRHYMAKEEAESMKQLNRKMAP